MSVKSFDCFIFLEKILPQLVAPFLPPWGGRHKLDNFLIISENRSIKRKCSFSDFSKNFRKGSLKWFFFALRSGFCSNLFLFGKLRWKKENILLCKIKTARKKKTLLTKIALKKFQKPTIFSEISNSLTKKILFYKKNFSPVIPARGKSDLFAKFLINKNRFYLLEENFNFFKVVIMISTQNEISFLLTPKLIKSKHKTTSFLINNSLGVIYSKKSIFLKFSFFLNSTRGFFFSLDWLRIKKSSIFSRSFFHQIISSLIFYDDFKISSKLNIKFKYQLATNLFSFYFDVFNQFFCSIFKDSLCFIGKKKKHILFSEKEILYLLEL